MVLLIVFKILILFFLIFYFRFLFRKNKLYFPQFTKEIRLKGWSNNFILLITFLGLLLFLTQPIFIKLVNNEIYQIIIFNLISLIIIILIIHLNNKQKFSFGLEYLNIRLIIWSFLSFFIFLIICELVVPLYNLLLFGVLKLPIENQEVLENINKNNNLLYIATSSISAGVIIPILEEMVFRGIVFPKLVQKYGVIYGIIVCSLIFSILHFHAGGFLPLFILSAILCILYWSTKTLWSCFLLHIIHNIVTILKYLFG